MKVNLRYLLRSLTGNGATLSLKQKNKDAFTLSPCKLYSLYIMKRLRLMPNIHLAT